MDSIGNRPCREPEAGVPSAGHGRTGLLVAQAILIPATLAAAIMAPPREGTMLILPVGPARQGMTARWAMEAGASIAAPGPVAGSLIVWGDRGRMAPAALRHASLLLAAPLKPCGGR